MRSISLPNVDRFKEASNRYEDLSVVIGWVVNLLNTFAYVLDAPLRYPVKLLGSHSSIIDHVKVLDENKTVSREFPLYLKSAKCNRTEWDRFDYGVFLLNKNLSQLRWQCGKPTTDLRPLLQNVADLMALGKDSFTIQEIVSALPRIRSLTLPPRSTPAHTVLIKSPNKSGVPSNFKLDNKAPRKTSCSIEDDVKYPKPINDESNSQMNLQSQISHKDSQTQRNTDDECDIQRVASNSSLDPTKHVNHENEINTTQNTRSLSNSSSSSYDTIEPDKLSDDITDTKTDEDDIINICSQSVSNIVRKVTNYDSDDMLALSRGNAETVPLFLSETSKRSEQNVDSKSFQNLQSPKRNEIADCDKEHIKEENLKLFWGDVTSRANALSKPSSFQRPRANH